MLFLNHKKLELMRYIHTILVRFIFCLLLKMKNKIQILVFTLVAVFWFACITNAEYKLTGDDLKQFNSQKATISQASNNWLWSYYKQLWQWYNILKSDDRLATISSGLRDYAYSLFDSRKKLAKQQNVAEKSKFLDEYRKNISINEDFPMDYCVGWYNTIDNISFANDFPTALTIAVWYKESNCGYYLPANGDGPFQIVSKDYGNWEITEELFKQTVQDFIDFAKDKIDSYNKKANEEFPEIKINYTSFDYTGVVSFAALYNWWTRTGGMVVPNAPKYVFDGYGQDYANAKKYGLLPALLKVLAWEVDNM